MATFGCVDCKKIFLAGLTRVLAPLHERQAYYQARPELVREVLAAGTARAGVEAEQTMDLVRGAMRL
jgi:tryptophanyl-tRNA synthetase